MPINKQMFLLLDKNPDLIKTYHVFLTQIHNKFVKHLHMPDMGKIYNLFIPDVKSTNLFTLT